jgi:hypothetical protein
VIQFEKWNKWEFIRMMERELRLIFNGFGKVLEFKNGIDYDLNKKSYKNPLLFLD